MAKNEDWWFASYNDEPLDILDILEEEPKSSTVDKPVLVFHQLP